MTSASKHPDFIPLPSRGIIHGTHVVLQDVGKGLTCISRAVQFLAGPDGVEIVPPASLVKLMNLRLLVDELVQDVLVF